MQKTLLTVLIGLLVASIIAITACLGLYLGSHSVETEQIRYHECAICRAHIIDYWMVRDMEDTEWIELCQFCYKDLAYD